MIEANVTRPPPANVLPWEVVFWGVVTTSCGPSNIPTGSSGSRARGPTPRTSTDLTATKMTVLSSQSVTPAPIDCCTIKPWSRPWMWACIALILIQMILRAEDFMHNLNGAVDVRGGNVVVRNEPQAARPHR